MKMLLLMLVLLLTPKADKPPHIAVTIQNTTTNTVNIGLAYYDASNNFLGSGSHSVAANASATDTQTFVAYKVVVTVISGSCTTLDFWDSSYTYDGGCASNVGGVSGGTFYASGYINYVLLVNNKGCR